MAFEQFKILTLKVIFRADEDGTLPVYLGSTLRGSLGHAMRNLVCYTPMVKCHQCHLARDCNYAKYFNSPGNISGAVNPFVLHTTISNKTVWKKGDYLHFGITIIGESTASALFYIEGILKMGSRGLGVNRLKFSPVQIINEHEKSLIWSNGERWGNNIVYSSLPMREYDTNSVLIYLESPTRILVRRKLLGSLRFDHIIQSLTRRINLLARAYTKSEYQFDEEMLVREAEKVRIIDQEWNYIDFKRYSKSYDRKLSLPAINGYARFEGEITPFTPILEAGTVLQLGKNATHGFGRYSLFYS